MAELWEGREGQGSLAYCSPWGHRFRHNLATEQQLSGEGKQDSEIDSEYETGSARHEAGPWIAQEA